MFAKLPPRQGLGGQKVKWEMSAALAHPNGDLGGHTAIRHLNRVNTPRPGNPSVKSTLALILGGGNTVGRDCGFWGQAAFQMFLQGRRSCQPVPLPTDPWLQHPSGCRHQKLCQRQNPHHDTAHPGQALGRGTQAQRAHKSSAGILVQSRRPIDSGALIGLHCSNTDLNYSHFSFFFFSPLCWILTPLALLV